MLFSPSHMKRPTRNAQTRRRLCQTAESLEPRIVLAADPIIAEFQAINDSTIQDEDGDFSDWIEVQNPDTEIVDPVRVVPDR